jgi:hypothetical protein
MKILLVILAFAIIVFGIMEIKAYRRFSPLYHPAINSK